MKVHRGQLRVHKGSFDTPSGPAFETKRATSDPMLFPGKASDSLLAAMPPTIVWEEEFDMYITPATRSLHCELLYLYRPG